MIFRTGIGYDVHRLEAGLPLWLGGIRIEHSHGLVGHSDADVLIHAICDALLGAASLGDIGQHFPDTDPAFKGIDSKILLSQCNRLVAQKGYKISNIDSVLCLKRPKIASYIPRMRETLANVLDLQADAISVKATTTEHLGFVGREEGVAAMATVALWRD